MLYPGINVQLYALPAGKFDVVEVPLQNGHFKGEAVGVGEIGFALWFSRFCGCVEGVNFMFMVLC